MQGYGILAKRSKIEKGSPLEKIAAAIPSINLTNDLRDKMMLAPVFNAISKYIYLGMHIDTTEYGAVW